MTGDPGPYVEWDGPLVWVPRTVPFREARRVAQAAVQQYGERAVYRGKVDADLLGFTRDCLCDSYCSDRYDEFDRETGEKPCSVPAWKFELVQR